MACQVFIIPILSDNYAYLIRDVTTQKTAIIDPGESQPIIHFCKTNKLSIDYILNTHHHHDHIGGNKDLKTSENLLYASYKSQQYGIQADRYLSEGDIFPIGNTIVHVIETPGHTLDHIVFWIQKDAFLFSGDTLFSLGCGRLFEGSPKEMWHSLLKIRALPPSTKIYPGHEYTLSNARFALTLTPENRVLKEKYDQVKYVRTLKKPSIPSTLEEEIVLNPFLKADNAAYKEALNLKDASDVEVFTYLRNQKDSFK